MEDVIVIQKPAKRGPFDLGDNNKSLDEILLMDKTEIDIATQLHMDKYDKLVQEFKFKTALTDLDLKILVFVLHYKYYVGQFCQMKL